MGSPHHGGAIEALAVRVNPDIAAAGVVSAPMGDISMEAINRIEKERSKGR
jgi:hypothetical protein